MKFETRKIVQTSFFVASAIALAYFFHLSGGVLNGRAFLPMHLPILFCGIMCGGTYGIMAGLITPFLVSLITGYPPIFPNAVYTSLELATYGGVSGLLFILFNNKKMPPLVKKAAIFIALLGAMFIGRVVLGVSQMLLLGFANKTFVLATFITSAFITALPGIVIQIIVVPVGYYSLNTKRKVQNKK